MKKKQLERLTRITGQHSGDIKELWYNGSVIRATYKGGDLYFSAADVAKAMNMSNGRITRLYLPDDQSTIINLPTAGGMQPMRMINAIGIMRVLGKSKKSESGPFMEWLLNRFYFTESAAISEESWKSMSAR